MKKINKSQKRSILTIILLSLVFSGLEAQSPMPEELMKSPIQDQLTFIQGRTKIFDNYRAIREDMFQKLMGNISDTLKNCFSKINTLDRSVSSLKNRADSLSTELESAKSGLETAIRTKDSFVLFGKEISKTAYNSIIWLIIIGLAVLLVMVFLSFRRSQVITRNTEKELKDLQDEFQAYRKTAREAREKMSMDHFNELRKLRGG
jgi:uncharacterized protein YoxC